MTAPTPNTPHDPQGRLALLEAELAPQLPPGAMTADADILQTYSADRAIQCEAEGAAVLVRAASTEDVQAVMRFASAHGIPVVPQGARTGISGGANAVAGCILLSVEKMAEVLEVNTAERTVTVQPGIINQQLKDHLRPYGLSYPPDPGSVNISSIGGNIATNAGGLCCVKYGVTKDYVRQLKVVLADGSLATLGPRTAKGVAGLDLRGLFIGSEGTLGIVVEATLRLVPLLAEPLTAVATFPDEATAGTCVAEFMARGAQPSMLELLDRTTLSMLNDYGDFGLDEQAGAMLLMQSDGSGDPATAQREVEAFAEVAESVGALDVAASDDPADSEALVATRRLAHPAYEKYTAAHGASELMEDVCLPRSRMPEFFARLAQLREESGIVIAVVAHAGDGNLHPAIFYARDDAEQERRAHAAFEELMQLGLDLGGTITGEHGVGSLKARWLAKELDPVNQRLHLAVKQAIDPQRILNPGKMLSHLGG